MSEIIVIPPANHSCRESGVAPPSHVPQQHRGSQKTKNRQKQLISHPIKQSEPDSSRLGLNSSPDCVSYQDVSGSREFRARQKGKEKTDVPLPIV